jgi:hypothetical protein
MKSTQAACFMLFFVFWVNIGTAVKSEPKCGWLHFFKPHFERFRRSQLPFYQKNLAKKTTLYCIVACHVVGLHRD